MKNFVAVVVLGIALSLSAFTSPAQDENACLKTSDLYIIGGSFERDKNGAPVVTGTIYNVSTTMAYDNVLLRAVYYNDDLDSVDTQTLRINEDIEEGEVEDFVVRATPHADVTWVGYTVLCAEED